MALRSTSDYIRDEQIALLRRDLDVLINELLSRDEGARLTSLRSFGPLGSLGAGGGLGERELSEWVNRYNILITLVNSRVNPQMVYAEVYPKFITDYAERPRDFQRPKRMEEFLHMDVTTLDHILQSYSLPRDLATLRRPDCLLGSSLLGRDPFGLSSPTLVDRLSNRHRLTREQKLIILFEHLGVDLRGEPLGGVSGRLGLADGHAGLGRGLSSAVGGGLLGGGRPLG